MSREWIDKTCEVCEYRVDYRCRAGPPVPINYSRSKYPRVCVDGLYTDACAQYREIGHEDDELKY